MADFDSLTAAVEREHTVNQSAIALINGFKARLDEADRRCCRSERQCRSFGDHGAIRFAWR
jgi:hypothetical protein